MLEGMSTLEIIKLFAPLLVLQLALMAFCIYRLVKDPVKYLPKWAWAIIIIFINLLGPILFLLLGRKGD